LSYRPQLFVPPIVLNKDSSVSLHRQIRDQIALAISSDRIPYEARLPSTRVLARILGVSRNTVLAAYEDLAADGLVRGETGSGMRINRHAPVPQVTLFGLRQVIRAAGYPARVLDLADQDGNSLYIRF
jgi:DNA-binding GntR family transcriptional regulator